MPPGVLKRASGGSRKASVKPDLLARPARHLLRKRRTYDELRTSRHFRVELTRNRLKLKPLERFLVSEPLENRLSCL